MENCEALGFIRQARALLKDETLDANSRELSMVITKLDEAELWRQRDMQLKTPIVNERSEFTDKLGEPTQKETEKYTKWFNRPNGV